MKTKSCLLKINKTEKQDSRNILMNANIIKTKSSRASRNEKSKYKI